MRLHVSYIALTSPLWLAQLGGWTTVPTSPASHAAETTRVARQLVLERINAIGQNDNCRRTLEQENIDLDLLRLTVAQTRFYDATGVDGDLKFSTVVGRAASPDQTLRTLASEVGADAFVLGYYDADRYVRTRHVVLTRGFHEQPDPDKRKLRPTTTDEKQSLLLHEILHIALGKDDEDLNSRSLCPLRLLALCPRTQVAIQSSE
jgi:hypothetical protein